MSTLVAILIFVGPILLIAVIYGIFEHRRRMRYGRLQRGTAPGTGDTVVMHGIHMGPGGGGHPTTHNVTRDPQKYAKAFVPANAKD